MSLRRDMHSAFDEIAPSMAGLPERVVQTVLVESSGRQRRERLMFRLRGPMSLVAVFVVIAMVVGVLIAGRVIQDWNAHHNAAPAGGINQAAQSIALWFDVIGIPSEHRQGLATSPASISRWA